MTRYTTIVADPPWAYGEGWPKTRWHPHVAGATHENPDGRRQDLPYQSLSVEAIAELPVHELADDDAHLLLWTTNRYVLDAYEVAAAWG